MIGEQPSVGKRNDPLPQRPFITLYYIPISLKYLYIVLATFLMVWTRVTQSRLRRAAGLDPIQGSREILDLVPGHRA